MGCFIYYFFWCIGLRSQVKALYWSNYFARHILLFFFLQSSFPLFLSQIYTFAIPVFVWCVLWHLFYQKKMQTWSGCQKNGSGLTFSMHCGIKSTCVVIIGSPIYKKHTDIENIAKYENEKKTQIFHTSLSRNHENSKSCKY